MLFYGLLNSALWLYNILVANDLANCGRLRDSLGHEKHTGKISIGLNFCVFCSFLEKRKSFSYVSLALSTKMALLKYLKLKSAPSCHKNLPDKTKPLCKEVLTSAICKANMEVMAVMKLTAGKRISYLKVRS